MDGYGRLWFRRAVYVFFLRHVCLRVMVGLEGIAIGRVECECAGRIMSAGTRASMALAKHQGSG